MSKYDPQRKHPQAERGLPACRNKARSLLDLFNNIPPDRQLFERFSLERPVLKTLSRFVDKKRPKV
jgi:hypothetical protein